jgi:hypothetical protein
MHFFGAGLQMSGLQRPRLSAFYAARFAWVGFLLILILLTPLCISVAHAWRAERALANRPTSSAKSAEAPTSTAKSPCLADLQTVPAASVLLADIQRAAPTAHFEAQFVPLSPTVAALEEREVGLALKAPYPVITTVVSEVLERYPASALLTLDIRRESQQVEQLDARLAFVFWVAADGAARCEGRKHPS